jgi:hypothetical protein
VHFSAATDFPDRFDFRRFVGATLGGGETINNLLDDCLRGGTERQQDRTLQANINL